MRVSPECVTPYREVATVSFAGNGGTNHETTSVLLLPRTLVTILRNNKKKTSDMKPKHFPQSARRILCCIPCRIPRRLSMPLAVCSLLCSLALLAASCSDLTDDDGTTLPPGKYPMTFTASVDGLVATRAATTDGQWSSGDAVAVQVQQQQPGGTPEVKQYTPTGSGNSGITLQAASGVTPFYWQTSGETKSVSAWYLGDGSAATGQSHATAVPVSWAVQSDQNASSGTGYQRSDFLYAPPTDISFKPSGGADNSLTFYHQTARVVINIVNAEAATNASAIQSVVIGDATNLALSGSYTAPTGEGATAGTWIPATSGSGMGTITPKKLTAPGTLAGGETALASYAALVIPQQMKGKKFIAVSLANGNTYYYTPTQDGDANLQSGKQHTYDITVKHGYLEVTSITVGSAWGSDGSAEDVIGKTLADGYAPNDLKIGDFYYSDGTTSDGGYRKYSDGTTAIMPVQPVLKDADGKERTVIGIVFWLGDIKGDNYTLLDSKFPSGTHGLVVSLWDMPAPDNGGAGMTWTYGGYEYVSTWLGSATWSGTVSRPGSFTSIHVTDKMQGYANTVALEEYNIYVENPSYSKDQNLRVKPIKGLAAFQTAHPAPVSSSGWYWPSICELQQVCWGQGNSSGTSGKSMLNPQIGKVGGTTFAYDSYYWSSTEYSSNGGYAWCVLFSTGNVYYYGGKSSHPYRVRPLLAF